MSKRQLPPEVRAYFQQIGSRNGKKLYKERGSQYFRDIAAKRKRHGAQKIKVADSETEATVSVNNNQP